MRRLILAAALAAASASFAVAPAMATIDQPNISSSNPSAAGVDDLGLDISGVTLTPSSVHSFLSSLPSETRSGVEAACSMYDQHPAGAGEQTLAFCADARA